MSHTTFAKQKSITYTFSTCLREIYYNVWALKIALVWPPGRNTPRSPGSGKKRWALSTLDVHKATVFSSVFNRFLFLILWFTVWHEIYWWMSTKFGVFDLYRFCIRTQWRTDRQGQRQIGVRQINETLKIRLKMLKKLSK